MSRSRHQCRTSSSFLRPSLCPSFGSAPRTSSAYLRLPSMMMAMCLGIVPEATSFSIRDS